MMNENSTTEKIVASATLISLFCILIPAVLSLWFRFIPDSDFVQSTKYLSYLVALILCLSGGYFSYKSGSLHQHVKSAGKKAIFLLFLPPLIFLVFIYMFQDGIPFAMHQFKSESGQKSYVISKRQPHYKDVKHGCDGGVFIEHSSISSIKICGLNRLDWNFIKGGERIVIYGDVSSYGINYDSYSIL